VPAVSLSIPEPHQEAVRELASLPNDEFDALLQEADKYEGAYSQEALEALLASRLKGTSELLNVLVSAHASLAAFDGADELAAAVIRAADVADPEPASARFTRLFLQRVFFATAKLLSLSGEVGRRVLSTRLVTDVRPAFAVDERSDGSPGDIVGMVVTHTLRVDSVHQGRVEPVFFALDAEQLDALRTELDRAGAKRDRLESWIASSGVRILEGD
jgi:hypothetical protein